MSDFNPDAFLAEDIPEQEAFDPNAFLESPEIADIGQEDTPIDKSPLSFKQRTFLGFSENQDETINYLKNNFEDAKKNENGKFLVKSDGLWHRVDEKKITIDDIADGIAEAPVILGGILGEVTGGVIGSVGGVPGTIAGAVGGGGVGSSAGEVVKQKIGQALGVRDELELNDILIEGGIGAAGAGLGLVISRLGKKATIQMIKQANKKSGNRIVGQVTDLIGDLNGTGAQNTKTLFQSPEKVMKRGAADPARLSQIADTVKSSIDDVLKKTGEIKGKIFKETSNLPAADPVDVFDNIIKDVDSVEKPLLQMLKESSLLDDTGKLIPANNPNVLKGKGMGQVRSVVKDLQNANKMSFRQLDSTIKRIDDLIDYDPVTKVSKSGAQAERILKKVRDSLGQLRNDSFAVADDFGDISDALNVLKDPANPKKNVFVNKASISRFIKTIYNDTNYDKLQYLEQMAKEVPGLEDALIDLRIHNAAKAYQRFLPPTKGGFGSAAGLANIGRTAVTAGTGGAAAPVFSPAVLGVSFRGLKAIARGLGKPGVAQTGTRIGLKGLGLR